MAHSFLFHLTDNFKYYEPAPQFRRVRSWHLLHLPFQLSTSTLHSWIWRTTGDRQLRTQPGRCSSEICINDHTWNQFPFQAKCIGHLCCMGLPFTIAWMDTKKLPLFVLSERSKILLNSESTMVMYKHKKDRLVISVLTQFLTHLPANQTVRLLGLINKLQDAL